MAEIKGLQVDVSMDTTKFEQGFSNLKRSMSTFNNVLKTTRNQIKYNEKTQEGYKNHMTNLKSAIENSEKNVKQLGEAYEDLSEAQKRGVKGNQFITQMAKEEDNLRRLRNELHETQMTYASTFTTMGKISQSFKSIGSGLQGVGQKAQDVGRSLSNSITKPALIAGTAAAGLTAKLGFDRLVGLDSAKAKLEGLGYSTKEVGSITDQVAKAIEGGMTTMAEGTDVAAGALAAGVKEGKDLEKYIKLVGDAAVGSNRPVSEMAMIFNRVQGQGKLMTQELNMVEEGMPGFSNAMAKHLGVSYDEFRNMVTNGEVTAKDFLTTMDDFAGGMANAYSKSWRGMVQNSKAYIGKIGEAFLSSTFQKAKGGLHEFEKMLKSPGAKQWATETGEKLGNAFAAIGNGIKNVINWWNGLDSSTQKVFGGIAKWLAITLVAVGPLLTTFGKLATVTGGMFSTFGELAGGIGKVAFASKEAGSLLGGLKEVFPKLGAAVGFFANPVGLVVAGIVALGTAFVIAYQKSETFRNIVNGVLEAVKNGFIVLWNVLKPVLAAIWDIVKTVFQQINDAGKEIITMLSEQFGPAFSDVGNALKTLQPVFETVMYAIKAVVDFVMPGIKAIIKNTFEGIKGIITGAVDIILGVVKIFAGLLTGNFSLMWSGVKQIFDGFIKIIVGIFKVSFVGQVIAFAKGMWTRTQQIFINLWKGTVAIFSVLGTWIGKKWQAIKDSVVNKVKGLWSGVRATWNILRTGTIKIMAAIAVWIIRKWLSIKNGVVNKAKALWDGVKGAWNALKSGTIKIMVAVAVWLIKKWLSIKNNVVNRVKALWSGVKNTWNNLKKGTTNIFKSVGSFMSSKWNSIKTGTVNKAKALWSGVKGAWGSLSKGTRNTMNAVGGFMSKKWKDIKSGTVDLVTGMKNKVTGVMNKMGDVIKSVTGKIGDFFGDMVKGVKTGLNKLIEGVNWVGEKLNMDKIDPIKLHTGTEHTNTTTNVVKNGKIARDTFATVGDKGRGNGPNGFRHEAIKYPNGKMALTPNRDTTAFLPKGSSVMNGAQTHSMLSGLPKFNNGTLSNKKPKKKKKGDNVFGDAWDASKAGVAKVVDGGKAIVSKTLETAAKGKKWLGDKVGDVMDWIEKPGKLLNKVLEAFGVNMEGFGIPKAASLPFDMMKGMFGKLKKAATDLFTKWMEEQGGGDGGYIDLSKGINFGFARTAAEAARMGYPFPRAHHGLDINYKYDKVYSTLNGMATAKKGYNGGFGNMVSIKSGALEAIYGHLHKIAFSGSKKVKPGTYLGISGGDPARDGAGAGSSTGPHLHYEMRKNGVPFDPRNWLKKNNGGGKSGKWSGDVKKALKLAGLPTSSAYVNAWKKQIQTESGGNPKALGGTDGLADGRAKGLVQVKPGTFNAYKLPGHGNIWNGLDNLIAGMRYAKARYGKGGMLGVIGKGHGYATGGLIKNAGWYNLAEGGYPEWVIPTDPSRNSDAMKLLALAAQDIESKNKRNKRPNQMRTPSTSGNSNDNTELLLQMIANQQRQLDALMQIARSNKNIEQQPKGFTEGDVSRAQGKRSQMMAYNMGGVF